MEIAEALVDQDRAVSRIEDGDGFRQHIERLRQHLQGTLGVLFRRRGLSEPAGGDSQPGQDKSAESQREADLEQQQGGAFLGWQPYGAQNEDDRDGAKRCVSLNTPGPPVLLDKSGHRPPGCSTAGVAAT